MGDSISQGFDADAHPWDHPNLSWVQGTDTNLNSVFQRYQAVYPAFSQQPQSVSGAEMVGGDNNFAAQASRICAQGVKPQRVFVLLGGNDVCNRTPSTTSDATANMYSLDTWLNAIRAGADQLAACLPPGSVVQFVSVPRIDYLYNAAWNKNWWCSNVVYPTFHICNIVTGESDPSRRAQIGQRINDYNTAEAQELAVYNSNANGKNSSGVVFLSDWQGSIEQGYQNTSVGTYEFTSTDINGFDCFHPNEVSQSKLACLEWAYSPDGSGQATATACLTN